jgi:hypothetical protein
MSHHLNSGIVWKGGKTQILGDNTNKSEWHSWWNQE